MEINLVFKGLKFVEGWKLDFFHLNIYIPAL